MLTAEEQKHIPQETIQILKAIIAQVKDQDQVKANDLTSLDGLHHNTKGAIVRLMGFDLQYRNKQSGRVYKRVS